MALYPRRGLHGQVVSSLGQRIVSGVLSPGDPVDVESVEREFDVSRTVVREAVRVLAGKGLVDARPKRGTFVRPRADWGLLDPDVLRWQFEYRTDAAFFDTLAEVRDIFEPAGVRLAAIRRTDADIADIEASLRGMNTTDPPEQVIEADLRFHRSLLYATHNELLYRMEIIIEPGLRARDSVVHGYLTWEDAIPRHRAVFDAVVAGDPGAAEAAMVDLLHHSAQDAQKVRSDDAAT